MRTVFTFMLFLASASALAKGVAYFEGQLTPVTRVRVVLSDMEMPPNECNGQPSKFGTLTVLTPYGRDVRTYEGCWKQINDGKVIDFYTYFDNRWNHHHLLASKFESLN